MRRIIHSPTPLTAFALLRPKIRPTLRQRVPHYEEQNLPMLPKTFQPGAYVSKSGKSRNSLR